MEIRCCRGIAGFENDVASLLIQPALVEVFAELFDPLRPAQIPRQFHATASTSSRTRCSRITEGLGWSKKNRAHRFSHVGAQFIPRISLGENVLRKTLAHEPAIGFLGDAENDFHVRNVAERREGDKPAFDCHRAVWGGRVHAPAHWLQAVPPPTTKLSFPAQKTASPSPQLGNEGEKNMFFVDIWASCLGPDGEPRPELYVADKLHPSAEQYQIRAKLIRPTLEP